MACFLFFRSSYFLGRTFGRRSASRALPLRGLKARPQFENLESRTVPSTVHWINPTGGDWSVASNWDTGAVPGQNDDVVIDMPGDYTVMHIAGADAVHSITSRHPLVLYSGGSIDLAATSNFSDLRIAGGDLSGNGNIIVHGDLEWTAGTISGTPGSSHSWIAAEGQLHISEYLEKTLDSRDLDNYGWATLDGGPVTLRHANFDNHINATLDTLDTATIQDAAAYDGEFINGGLVRVFSGLSLNTYIVTNRGAIDVNGGWLTDSNTLSRVVNVGQIVLGDASGGLSLNVNDYQQEQQYPTLTTGSIIGAGNVSISVPYFGLYNIAGAFHIDGNASFTGETIQVYMPEFYVGGNLTLDGLPNGYTGQVRLGAASIHAGSITVGGNGHVDVEIGSSTLSISGNLIIAPNGRLGTDFTLAADISAETITNNGTFFLNPGSSVHVIEGVYNLGTMTASGTVDGDLINEGQLNLGSGIGGNRLIVTGNFVQTGAGTLTVRIGSSNPDAPNDQLIVGGMAILDGTLTVRMMNGYQPNNSDSFQFLSSARIAGDFAAFNMPDLGTGYYLASSNDGSSYSLVVEQS